MADVKTYWNIFNKMQTDNYSSRENVATNKKHILSQPTKISF